MSSVIIPGPKHERAPDAVCCRRCRSNKELYRADDTQSLIARTMTSRYKCSGCEHQFSELNMTSKFVILLVIDVVGIMCATLLS